MNVEDRPAAIALHRQMLDIDDQRLVRACRRHDRKMVRVADSADLDRIETDKPRRANARPEPEVARVAAAGAIVEQSLGRLQVEPTVAIVPGGALPKQEPRIAALGREAVAVPILRVAAFPLKPPHRTALDPEIMRRVGESDADRKIGRTGRKSAARAHILDHAIAAVIADTRKAAFEIARLRPAHVQPNAACGLHAGRRGIFDDAITACHPDVGNPHIAYRFANHEQAVADIAGAHVAIGGIRAHDIDRLAVRGDLNRARNAAGGHVGHAAALGGRRE